MPLLVRGNVPAPAGSQTFPYLGNPNAVWELRDSVAIHVDDEDYVEALKQAGQPVRQLPQAVVDAIPKTTRAALYGANTAGTVTPWSLQLDSVPGVARPVAT